MHQSSRLSGENDAAGDRAEDPLRPVLEAILDRLKAFPCPRDVDPKVLSRQQAGKIAFQEIGTPLATMGRMTARSSTKSCFETHASMLKVLWCSTA